MNIRKLVMMALAGMCIAVIAAIYYSRTAHPQPPAFKPTSNPYANGIFANGIIETLQESGENTNIYPEVASTVTQIVVKEGQWIHAGDTILTLDDSVQRGVVKQLEGQLASARANLEALTQLPRPEVLAVAKAQAAAAEAQYAQAQSQYDKRATAYALDSGSLSKDTLDTYYQAAAIAARNRDVANKQLELTQAGAWTFDIQAQQNNVKALEGQTQSAIELLKKYTIKAISDTHVLRINATIGNYVNATGVYDPYIQSNVPLAIVGSLGNELAVRVFVDEVLLSRLGPMKHLEGQLQVRGTDLSIPLSFVRSQPYVTPKIQLSNQRSEQVDLRVLPLIFKFKNTSKTILYPGQLVDIYIKGE